MAGPFTTNLFGQERDDVGIHPNSVGTAELENGSVTAAKLATSFPQGTLGYAEVTAGQPGISTVVDLTGLVVTVPVLAGRRIRIIGQAMFHNQLAAANWAILQIVEGSTILNDALVSFDATGSNQQYGSVSVAISLTPTAGTHTYKLQAFATSGTVNMMASSTRRPFILVEDITAITASQPIAVPTGLWRASADFPANPAHGDLFYETDTDKLWAWGGTAWVQQIASGAWDTWTPTLSQGATVASNPQHARWTRSGRTITGQFRIAATAAGTAGSEVAVSLPVAALTTSTSRAIGHGWLIDVSVATYVGTWNVATTGTASFITDQSGTNGNPWGILPNVALANFDVMAATLTYEAAAST